MRSTTMSLLSIFLIVFLFSVPPIFAQQQDQFEFSYQLNLPSGGSPDSVALDPSGRGPYISVSDGRILKYNGTNFVYFAHTAPNRNKALCDGVTDVNMGPICGRSLSISFNRQTGVLYMMDAFFGFFQVGPEGGQATLIANSAGGLPFHFPLGVDVHPETGVVYLVDGSQTINLLNISTSTDSIPIDSTGRLIRYNPNTEVLEVLVGGLSLPQGPAVSLDSSFVAFSEYGADEVLRYWLTGPDQNTVKVLLNVPGNPVKTKRASGINGEFWTAVNVINHQALTVKPFGYKFDSNGNVLLVKDFGDVYQNQLINLVQEYGGLLTGKTLYVGSFTASFVGVYKSPPCLLFLCV